jgi:hypothetical protein
MDPTDENGKRSSFRNVMFFTVPEDGQSKKLSNPKCYTPSSEPSELTYIKCDELSTAHRVNHLTLSREITQILSIPSGNASDNICVVSRGTHFA